MKDAHLLRLAKQGQTQYLNEIAARYYDDVYRFCRFQTGEAETAADLTQDTFLRFFCYVETVRTGNLKGFLFAIARNVCRDHWREKSRRKEEPFPDEAGTVFPLDAEGELPQERSETRLMLQDALLCLPDFQREAVVLRYMYSFRYHEIGKMTGVSAATAKSRVMQGCKKLRGLLGERENGR